MMEGVCEECGKKLKKEDIRFCSLKCGVTKLKKLQGQVEELCEFLSIH